ncbi:hypothetical protein [Chitinophaga arvensicola]|uniref:Uncharacterized protein n=1 Tax=Chitinophaga arvensicola TaxID=29529 RepID=A0A1I0S7A0_9BACT|nr:hypothetical protein [Chitinophaga arvensicola]SEW51624.1 hypothetical protein SAMN04488122_4386 [Chitinophaga arvensicola]
MFIDLKVHISFPSDSLTHAAINNCEVFSFKQNDIILDRAGTAIFVLKG